MFLIKAVFKMGALNVLHEPYRMHYGVKWTTQIHDKYEDIKDVVKELENTPIRFGENGTEMIGDKRILWFGPKTQTIALAQHWTFQSVNDDISPYATDENEFVHSNDGLRDVKLNVPHDASKRRNSNGGIIKTFALNDIDPDRKSNDSDEEPTSGLKMRRNNTTEKLKPPSEY